ncbi:O-phosphoseryl-tRNA(Sec) selenium transferase [Calliphora vicina]|uniref:O-phosphoseryl-tRNA(Sec) selenium transferase n=1 Tax=Calliphora vicina TaxID=7373 RepID=UPI00325A4FDE
MNFSNLKISEKLVPSNYLKLAVESQKSKEVKLKELLEKRSLPEDGWSDDLIEYTVQQLACLDSNNFPHKAGLGEREARIVSNLVARRHYNFGHGIGRSGDLLEAQPKAVGSSILSQLTNAMLLDLMRAIGIKSCDSCFLVPLATGMTLTLCFLSLRKQRPQAKYILWSRIDQKSCFKSMTTAGFIPIIINPIRKAEKEGLFTDLEEFSKKLETLRAEEILCIMSTTSCFAPRNMDEIYELAQMAEKYNVPHVINNAYGLQSQYICAQIQRAFGGGRVDLFVQSTDKNLMVPVGGALVAGCNKEIVHNVAKTYAGRASSSQSLDVFMTLLSLGKNGYLALSQERRKAYDELKSGLSIFANSNNFTFKHSKSNPISMAVFFDPQSIDQPTKLGSMLYTRGISGTRVVARDSTKTIDGYEFKNWGTHEDRNGPAYLTAAATLGLTLSEIEVFLKKLNECWKDLQSQKVKNNKIQE